MKKLIILFLIILPAGLVAQVWTQTAPLSSPTDYIYSMADDGNGNVVASSWAVGIYKTTNNGVNWNTTSYMVSTPRVYKLICAPNGIFYALANSTSSIRLYRSTDSGDNWTEVYNESRPNNFALGGDIVFIDSMNYLAGMSFTIGPTIGDIAARIVRSTDGGATWNIVTLLGAGFLNAMVLADDGRIYGGTSLGGVIVSTNNGVNWSITSFTPYVADMDKNSEGVLYIGTSNASGNSVWKSTDNGSSWIPLGVGESTVEDLHIDNEDNIYVSNSGNLYRSTNGGNNWSLFETGIPSGQTVYSITGSESNFVFAGTGSSGVYRNGTATSVIQTNSIASKFKLEQNYPNPFNPVTNIEFSIPERGHITLEVFDIYGRRVSTLVNGDMNVGNYKTLFNAESQSSGTYFYRLDFNGENNTFTETKKMIVIK
ncbi:MAG: T9SS type A sorting domain-containing protein [Ignavibacteriae bacterium]|nr:T9SS type A sorting domain-containing protein [Ignavibacteriota bacterium]MCB9243105.1 T9SS type A sorting domain-containing protein [Ignavibacteriales bacterium]